MAPTPTPTPSPGGLGDTSPMTPEIQSVIDAAITAPNDANLDAMLNGTDAVSRTIFGVDYIPSAGLIVTVSPWVIAVTLAVAVVGGVLVARRRARRSDEVPLPPAPDARLVEQRLAERDALAKVTAKAAEDVNR